MEHAWLDSLSEDWVSQPGSDTSAAQLPSLKSNDSNIKSKETPSRIPRRTVGARSQPSNNHDTSVSVLNERSANDINVSRQRLSFRPSQETKSVRGVEGSRSVSAATNGSVIHNTVNHKSPSPSGRSKGETPEWKRRLIYGDVQYGEQRDLFCSAAAGLQDMFKPPEAERALEEEEQHETTMPSSPPMYPERVSSADLHQQLDALGELEESDEDDEIYPNEVTPSPSPRRVKREIQYRLNVDDSALSQQSGPDDATPSRQRDEIYRDESCLTAPPEGDANSRKTSGQSVLRNEDFSPILIGRQSDQDGEMDFAPIDLAADKLKHKLENLRINQMLLSPEMSPEAILEGDNLPDENSSELGRRGAFINVKRGETSTHGSFRYQDLGPGLGVDTSEMLPEESLQASTPKQFPSVRTNNTNPYANDDLLLSPNVPRAPFPSPEKRHVSGAANTTAGGSPLKLFGPYDTFTNQTLLRRISQFEEGMSGTESQETAGSVMPDDQSRPAAESQEDPDAKSQPPHMPQLRSVSRFGGADLEGYEFDEDASFESQEQASDKENESPQHPLFSHPVEFPPQREPSPDEESELFVRRRRNKSRSSSINHHTRSLSTGSQAKVMSPAKGGPTLGATPKRDAGSEGKRPRTSPSKDPTPKRRRTLHRSDIAFGRDDLSGVDSAHRQMQSIMGKKRIDSRPGGFQLADPSVLAMRDILQPYSPSSSRKSSRNISEHSFDGLHFEEGDDSVRVSPRRETLDGNAGDQSAEADRKPSIRTQDFVDQAAQIMAMIRNQVGAPGLASVEESEAEYGTPNLDDMDDSYQSTKEPLSRPPSRDGKPVLRQPLRQEDPELIDRLKKYQELSDMGDVISSSMRSMGLAKDAIRAAQEVERQLDESSRSRSDGPYTTDGDIISDPPNIRLSTNPALEVPGSPSREFATHSSGDSTNRTYPTGSSRGSDSRRIIMPESVSHLIPDRVGSMYLDKQHNIWIKKKEAVAIPVPVTNILPSDESEDDPFASIPDLSVDMTKEMQNLLLATAQKESKYSDLDQLKSDENTPSQSPQRQTSRGYVTLSPDGQLSPDVAPLAREEFDKLEVRAMQGSDVDPDKLSVAESALEEEKTSTSPSASKRRNMTISFSSPLASIIQDMAAEDLDSLEDDPERPDEDSAKKTSPRKGPGFSSIGKSALKNGGHTNFRNTRAASRHVGPNGPAFIPRPVSRIDEQDEESTIEVPIDEDRQISIIGETSVVSHKTPDGRRASLSFLVNHTPYNNMLSVPADDSAMIGQNVGKLSLSPLSEFTLNNSDQSFGFEVSYVMGPRHMATGEGSRKVMSMTIRELVDRLSEVEPYEPYWEDITELDIHEKRLASLHMLDEFCGKLVTLDASKNALGHLHGVPSSVRQLKVSQNMLTELTSWDHLMNLQYVDISGNEIKSLSALKSLVHLRSIKADDNQLTSLDGLDCHDGLLSLRARNNLIEEVDFARVKLDRLMELDLDNNCISSVRHLEQAPALSKLRLPKNRLESFVVGVTVGALRHLDLGDNQLNFLDVSNLPNLHALYADRNRLVEVKGFHRTHRLDSLSLREQGGDQPLDLSFLSTAYEVRKLFLSGNYIGTFDLKVDYLNLQLLELANCGIQSLPETLGQLVPNLRVLNVNFNAIHNLEPLRFVPRLKKLHAAGNRLADSTEVTELLIEFPHLTQLDLRDNPVTIGFYPSIQVMVPMDHADAVDPFTLPDSDIERDDTFAKRLDEPTKLRRRLHQIVFAASCKRLRRLDGLSMNRKQIFSKDGVFRTLVSEGLLPEDDAAPEKPGACPQEAVPEQRTGHATDTIKSSKWNAEDSFG